MAGTLYIVATPIGNLQDMTFRAVETLRSVDLIACEDTRHTQKLLNHYRISNRTISLHEHNEDERADQLIDRLIVGGQIAVVSDAGTPTISDPGFRLVRRCIEAGINVVSIPGAVAFVTALASSGAASDSVFFGGFLPQKKGERRRRLEEVRDIPATLAFYEAPHRLEKSLTDCADVLGDRRAVVARELTKIHEETVRGRLSDLVRHFKTGTVRGEIVLLIERPDEQSSAPKPEATLPDRVAELESEGLDRKKALKQAAKEFGMSKSEAYKLLV